MKYNFNTLLLIPLLFFTLNSYSQSRSSIGISFGYNVPVSNNDYKIGGGGSIQGAIALGDKWAILPSIGIENMNSKGRTIYGPYGYPTGHIQDITLIYIGAAVKYSFDSKLFAKAGAMLYVGAGGDDVAAAGPGGSVAFGYNLDLDRHSSLQLYLNTDVVYVEPISGNGITPVVSLNLAYVFNFRGLK